MKFLEKYLHKMEPHFIKGGKYEKWNPLFETLATFAFTPKLVTTKGTHIRDGVDLKRTMFTVVIALIPCLLFGIYNTGHWEYAVAEGNRDIPYFAEMGAKFLTGLTIVLPVVVVSYGVGLTIEFIFGMLRGHSLHEGFLVSGMLIPLTMPADVPLWMVAIATAFAVIIGKEIFGGTGMNVVNIALTARAFLFFAYPTSMSGDKVWMSGLGDKMSTNSADLDGFSGATALGDLASFMSDKATVAGETVQSSMALQNFSTEYGVWESFVGMIPGSIGETSTLACLIGGLLLVLTGVGSLRIILSFFAGGFVMGLLLNAIGGNPYLDLAAHHHLVIGGFAFGAVFMATDPVTASQTAFGKIIYGFLGGLLAIMIRVLNPAYPEGVFLAILFMNIMAPIIDHYIIQANINRRLKRLKTA
ncbi:MAG: NADH:ubiquinone reductase (Na(+)-transporting) subunit B [Crocinitomicaceae bacterium]|nr:NADH:ubiquinone reductase (Na(+)-transporting) subunit B [Crocinitomicaceae bacterium]MDG1734700.1 NADH:ubiquinone reductase (Na(+)-transporting) subunit B [Crocinitomicaceae bacterium]